MIFHMNSKFKQLWPRTNGIYKITNRKTGRFYIGKAEGKYGFYKRWSKHRSDLRKNIHHCSYLQNSFNKNKESCFTFEVLEIKNYGELLSDLESEYIFNLKAMYFEGGYNMVNEKFIGEYPTIYREEHHSSKEFELLDPQGNLIKGRNLTKFCEDLGFNANNMCNVLSGVAKSYKGYKSPNPALHPVKKEYRLLSPEKKLMIFDTIAGFAREMGLTQNGVFWVLRGKYSNTKGYHLENPSPKNQKRLDRLFNKKLLLNKDLGIIIRFISTNAFALKYEIPVDTLYNFFAGKGSFLTKDYNWCAPTDQDMELYPIVEETF